MERAGGAFSTTINVFFFFFKARVGKAFGLGCLESRALGGLYDDLGFPWRSTCRIDFLVLEYSGHTTI